MKFNLLTLSGINTILKKIVMKIQKVLILFFFFVFFFHQSFSQNNDLCENYYYGNFDFAGNQNGEVIYQFFPPMGEEYEKSKKFDLFKIRLQKDGRVTFKYYKNFENNICYISDEYLLYWEDEQIFTLKRNSNSIKIDLKGDIDIYNRTHYLTQGNYFYFSTEINKINYLARINLSAKEPKMEILPLKGKEPILLGNWLYYTIAYKTSDFAVGSVSSIYRVKVGDWRKPELLIDYVEFGGAVIDTNLLSFTVYDRNEWRKVTYNILDSSYIEKGISSLIKYKGKKYQRTLCKNPKTGKTQLCFEELPELPDKFPHKLNRDIESNHNYFHLPHTEKPFTGTFITDRLMFYAGKDELQNLSKSQLRILRNAFYAREGYDFKSADLRELFSQFDWYKKTLERRKIYDLKNEDIFIPSCDMERINLILEVERNK